MGIFSHSYRSFSQELDPFQSAQSLQAHGAMNTLFSSQPHRLPFASLNLPRTYPVFSFLTNLAVAFLPRIRSMFSVQVAPALAISFFFFSFVFLRTICVCDNHPQSSFVLISFAISWLFPCLQLPKAYEPLLLFSFDFLPTISSF